MRINLETRARERHRRGLLKMQKRIRKLHLRAKQSAKDIRNKLETIERAKYGDDGYEHRKALKNQLQRVRALWGLGGAVFMLALVAALWIVGWSWWQFISSWIALGFCRDVGKWHVRRVENLVDAELRLAGLADMTHKNMRWTR